MRYTLYVDESGQSGIKNIRTPSKRGASRYMTLGGVLVPETEKLEIRRMLSELAKEFGKQDLHCSRLNHNQLVKYARGVARTRVLIFGVISLKSTLRGYAEEIGKMGTTVAKKALEFAGKL